MKENVEIKATCEELAVLISHHSAEAQQASKAFKYGNFDAMDTEQVKRHINRLQELVLLMQEFER